MALNNRQKELLHSIAGGLRKDDKSIVELSWTVSWDGAERIIGIYGINNADLQRYWVSTAELADFDKFVRDGYFISKGEAAFSHRFFLDDSAILRDVDKNEKQRALVALIASGLDEMQSDWTVMEGDDVITSIAGIKNGEFKTQLISKITKDDLILLAQMGLISKLGEGGQPGTTLYRIDKTRIKQAAG